MQEIETSPPTQRSPHPIRVAIVGTGAFGQLHLDAFLANPDCRVVGLVSADASSADSLARRFDIEHSSSTLAELLDLTQVDAVSVVNASSAHLATAVEGLRAGASVLVEKPVVISGAQGRVLKQAADESAGFVMPAHILRFAGPYRELRRRVQSGAVGRPRVLSFRRHRSADHDTQFADVHPVFLTMIHDIDLALWLTGSSPTRVTAREIRAPGRAQPLAVVAEVELADETLLTFQVSWSLSSGSLPDACEVIGDDGVLALSLGARVHEFSTTRGAVTLDDVLTPGDSQGALQEEVRAFVDAVRFRTPNPIVTLDEALVGIELAERIVEAAGGLPRT